MTNAAARRRAPDRVTTVPTELLFFCPRARWRKKPPDWAMIPMSRSRPASHWTPVEYPVEVEEVDEREHQQHPSVGVPCPEKLLSELPELAASGEEPE
jgi:hypothetical protein